MDGRMSKFEEHPKYLWRKVKPDPAGGWGGPPYPQEASCSEEGVVRYIREDVAHYDAISRAQEGRDIDTPPVDTEESET